MKADELSDWCCNSYIPVCVQARTSNESRKLGIFIIPSGVRSVWLHHNLANFKNRLKVLEAKVENSNLILTEGQVQALEKKALDDEACGEIETAQPVYLGSQDAFYVGILKGVGCIYQLTYVAPIKIMPTLNFIQLKLNRTGFAGGYFV